MIAANEPRFSDLVNRLHLMLEMEREDGFLTRLDAPLIAEASAEIERLVEQIRACGDHDLIDHADAISAHLDEILGFRTRKINISVGWRKPENMTPAETAYFDTLEAARQTLEATWRTAA